MRFKLQALFIGLLLLIGAYSAYSTARLIFAAGNVPFSIPPISSPSTPGTASPTPSATTTTTVSPTVQPTGQQPNSPNPSPGSTTSVGQGVGKVGTIEPIELPNSAGGRFGSLDAILTQGIPELLIQFVGLLALVYFLLNGWKYLSSSANEQGVNDAKQGLLYAGVGLVLALLSYAIVALLNGYFR